jgi:hypothetical protein
VADAFTSDTYNALCREAEDYLGRGLTEQARELLLKAVSLIGTRSRARSLLADACMALGLWSEAGEQLEQLITLELGSVQHHYRLGQVLEELQEKDKALDNYRVVLDLEPSHRGASVAVSRMAGRAAEAGPEPELPAGPVRMPSSPVSGEVHIFPDEPGAEDVFATSGDVENLLRDIGVGQTGEAETGVTELLSSVGINLSPAVEEEKPPVEVTDVSTLMGTPETPGHEAGFSLESVFGGAPEPVSAAAAQVPTPAPEPAGAEPFDFTSIFRTALEPAGEKPPATPGPAAASVEPARPDQAAAPAESEPLLQSIFGEPATQAEPSPAVPAPPVETPPDEVPSFAVGAGSEPILQAVFGTLEPASPAGPSVAEPASGAAAEPAEPEPPLPSIFWEEPPVPGGPAPSILEAGKPAPAEPPVSAPQVEQPALEEIFAPADSGPQEGPGVVAPASEAPSVETSEPEPAEPASAPQEPSVLEELPLLEAVFMADAETAPDAAPDAVADATAEPVADATAEPVADATAEPVAVPMPVEQEEAAVVQLPAEPAVETPPEGAGSGVDGGAFSLEIVFGAAASGGDQPVPPSGDAAGAAPAGGGIDGTQTTLEPASVDGASAEPEGEAPGSMPAPASDADAGAAPGGAEVVETHVPALFDIHPAGQDDLLVVDLIEGGLELKLAYLMAFDSSMTITAEGPRRILSGTGMMVLGQAFRSPVTLSLAEGDLVRGDRLVFSDAGISFTEAGTDLLPSMLRVEGAGGQALAFTGGRIARIPLSGQPVSARAACVLLVPAGAEVSPDPDNPGFIRLEGDGSLLVSS